MKKIIVRVLIAVVVVLILAVLAVGLLLDRAIKSGVETFGPKFTKVDIKLQSVSLSLFSGVGTIKGLVVGNPEGFKAPSAINVGEATVALKPSSLLSSKIIIKSVKVQGPEITFEANLKNNNLGKILSNVQEATSGGRKEPAKPQAPPPPQETKPAKKPETTGGGQKEPAKPQEPSQPKEAKPAKKLEVDEFIITGGKVHLMMTALGGGTATLPLPDIRLQNLGTGPDGITPAELMKRVLDAIQAGAAEASSGAVADSGKEAVQIARDAENAASNNVVEKVNKGIGGLLKR